MATVAIEQCTDLIRWLDASPDTGPATLGGKAAPLARLAGFGLRVPPGFVITPAAFPLDGDDAQAARAEIRLAYAELAQRLHAAEPVSPQSRQAPPPHEPPAPLVA